MVVAEPSESLAGEIKRLLPDLRKVVGDGRKVTICFDRGGWSPAPFADITASDGQLLIRLDPLTAPRRTRALAALCDQLTRAQACYPGTDLVLCYQVKPHPGLA